MTGLAQRAKNLLKAPAFSLERFLYLTGLRSIDRLTLPNFLILGSGQSGSSWLHTVLGSHPQLFLPTKKETHYFSRHFDEWPLSYYSSLFADGRESIRGEIVPMYNILIEDRIRTIRKLVPDVRLILIIRNPIERSWSEARRSLSKVARLSGKEFEDLDDAQFYDYFAKEWMFRPDWGGAFVPDLLQGYYSRTIDNWLAVFPENQFQAVFFQDIANNPRGLLRKVCEHIGADPEFAWDPTHLQTVVNKNPQHEMPSRFRKALEERYCDEIEELYRRFGSPVESWRCAGRIGATTEQR